MDTSQPKETSYHNYTQVSTVSDKYRQPYGLDKLIELIKTKPTPAPFMVDVGCGTGNHLIALRDQYKEAIGIDINEGMLSQFENKVKEDGLSGKIQIKKGSCLDLPLPSNSCNVVIMTQVLHHLGGPQSRIKAFSEAYRVLKPEGLFIINHTFDKQVDLLWPDKFVPTAKGKIFKVVGSFQDLLNFGGEAGFAFQRMEPISNPKEKLETYSKNPEGSTSFFSIMSEEEKKEMKATMESLEKENKSFIDLGVDLSTNSIIGDSAHLLFLKE